jgi:hypothetical protein
LTLVLQILIAIVVLVGLITAIMSIKNWHWAQMLLLLGIFLSALGTLVLGLEVFRIHRNLRRNLPKLEQQITDVENQTEALERGSSAPERVGPIVAELGDPATLAANARTVAESLTPEAAVRLQPITGTANVAAAQEVLRRWANNLEAASKNKSLQAALTTQLDKIRESNDLPSVQHWTQQLDDVYRQRGRVWRGVAPAGPIDAKTGRIAVNIPQPKPSGLAKDAILFAFQQGEPNAANPMQGAQYLGEFRAVEVQPQGAVLEPVIQLDQRTGTRIMQSQQAAGGRGGSWVLYETIPADRHELYANLSDAELKKRLPAASVDEYIRHGQKGAKDQIEEHVRASFDEAGLRLGPDDEAKAAEWRYDRQLRDYAYIFAEAARQTALALAERAALNEDITKLKTAQTSAEQYKAQRTEEKGGLAGDLTHIEADRTAIESLLAAVKSQLDEARRRLADLLAANSMLAQQLTQEQLGMLEASGQIRVEPQPSLLAP